MRKLIVAVAALGLAATASAGDYHKRDTLRCSECHTMHASRAHDFNANTLGADALPDQGNAHRKLLISNGTNETCLACHDGKGASGIPDVLGTNNLAVPGRSAGALNGMVGSHTAGAGYDDYMGHTLGSGATPPGYVGIYEPTPLENFNCANCHAVHGSSAYRNLGLSSYMGLEGMAFNATNPFTTTGPTYNALPAVGTGRATAFDAGRDVTIAVDGRNYDTANVQFGIGSNNTGAKNGMNAYCAVCHGNFHGDINTRDQIGGLDFVRHPTSAVVRDNSAGTLLNGLTATNLVRPSWTTTVAATANFEVACLSCHKGHGNKNGYGLIFPSDTAANVDMEQGDGAGIRNLCVTCHPMGRY